MDEVGALPGFGGRAADRASDTDFAEGLGFKDIYIYILGVSQN